MRVFVYSRLTDPGGGKLGRGGGDAPYCWRGRKNCCLSIYGISSLLLFKEQTDSIWRFGEPGLSALAEHQTGREAQKNASGQPVEQQLGAR